MKLLVPVGSVLIAIATVMYFSGRQPVNTTVANYARLKHGMTRAEVVAILGGPAGNYHTDKSWHGFHVISWCVPAGKGYGLPVYWTTDDGEVEVAFQSDDRAYSIRRYEVEPPRPLVERLTERVGQWFR